MKTLQDLNFEQLYAQHLLSARQFSIPASHWDARAESFAKRVVGADPRYIPVILDRIAIRPEETVLDIGSGPGTLALPLALKCQHVTALDYSPKMLEILRELAAKQGSTNIDTICKSWSDDWSDVPVADVVVASRATLADDLGGMIDQLTSKARDRVVLTAITRPSFFDPDLMRAIRRGDDLGLPTYIYLLNALYQRGIQAQCEFIDIGFGEFQGSVDELIESVRFSLGQITEKERALLMQFYNERRAANEPILQGQNRWAMLSWKVEH